MKYKTIMNTIIFFTTIFLLYNVVVYSLIGNLIMAFIALLELIIAVILVFIVDKIEEEDDEE